MAAGVAVAVGRGGGLVRDGGHPADRPGADNADLQDGFNDRYLGVGVQGGKKRYA